MLLILGFLFSVPQVTAPELVAQLETLNSHSLELFKATSLGSTPVCKIPSSKRIKFFDEGHSQLVHLCSSSSERALQYIASVLIYGTVWQETASARAPPIT